VLAIVSVLFAVYFWSRRRELSPAPIDLAHG
jgi:hypothetical protein